MTARPVAHGLIGVAVIVGGLCGITACGGSSAFSLPTCAQLGAALPGKLVLAYENGDPPRDAPQTVVNDPWLTCKGAGGIDVGVQLYGSGNYDIRAGNYPDGKTHDGAWRANFAYQELSRGMATASAGGFHGISTYSYGFVQGTSCEDIALDGNAVVNVITTQHGQPACAAIGKTELPVLAATL